MLSLHNVSVNYGAIEALTDISLHVEQGEVVTLIGANGAGKTTTLRTAVSRCRPKDAASSRTFPFVKTCKWGLI
jgi:branched-chain amino acid transport system ATP-binding protein